jgi:hypothetical protein
MSAKRTIAYLRPSTGSAKKWLVTIFPPDGSRKTVHFGAQGYEDFTMHHDLHRKGLYLKRHAKNHENWKKAGIATAGFWSRWLLWGEPSVSASIKMIQNKFNIQIKRASPH